MEGYLYEKQSNPKDPKQLKIIGVLKPNGSCDWNLEYSNLNLEQLAKLSLFIIRNLASIAFDKIHPKVDGVSYQSKFK
jgi:hypothetical protein